ALPVRNSNRLITAPAVSTISPYAIVTRQAWAQVKILLPVTITRVGPKKHQPNPAERISHNAPPVGPHCGKERLSDAPKIPDPNTAIPANHLHVLIGSFPSSALSSSKARICSNGWSRHTNTEELNIR